MKTWREMKPFEKENFKNGVVAPIVSVIIVATIMMTGYVLLEPTAPQKTLEVSVKCTK